MSINEAEVAKKILEDIECMYTILVQNRVCKRNKQFYCYLCKLEIKNLLDAICHATRDKEHNQRNKMCKISNENVRDSMLDEEKSVELVFNGIIILNCYPPECFCNICLCELPSINCTTEHIKGFNHINAKTKQNCDFYSTSTLASVGCNNPSSFDNKTDNSTNCDNKSTEQTKNIDSLPSTSNLDDSSENNEIDYICEDKPVTVYLCKLCKTQISMNNIVLKYHRMFHIADQNYSCQNIDVVKFIFKNRNEKYIYCLICDQVMRDEEELHKHLQDTNHEKNILVLKRNYNIKNDDKLDNPLLNLNYEGCHDQSSESKIVTEILLNCQACKISLPYSENGDSYKAHSKGNLHIQNLQKLKEKKTDFILKPVAHYLPILKCFLCDIEFTEERELWLHYSTDSHLYVIAAIDTILQEKTIIFISEENGNGLLCTSCKTKTDDLSSMINHIKGTEHQKYNQISTSKAKKEINLSNNSTTDNGIFLLDFGQDKVQMETIEEQENNSCYFCPICNVKEDTDFYLIEHLQSENHYKNSLANSSPDNIKYSCPICELSFDNDGQLIKHLKSVAHTIKHYSTSPQVFDDNIECSNSIIKQNVNSYTSLIDDSEVYVNTYTNESTNTKNIDAILHDLISFKPTEASNNQSALEIVTTTPDAGDSVDSIKLSKIGEQYISLCIEPGGNNIFSVVVDKLRKLQLGISLTFPIDTGRFCIPCSEEISVDSELFEQHLNDENHLKVLKQLIDRDASIKKCVEDQITDLDLAKSYMEGISIKSDYVKCFACNIKVKHCDIESHVSLQSHAKNIRPWKEAAKDIFDEKKIFFCDPWYYAEKFICDLCSLKFYSDITFADHLIKEEHLYRVRMAQHVNTKTEYNICGYCLTFWFGKANGYLTHCEGIFHKYLVRTNSHSVSTLPSRVQNILNNFEKTINELLESCEKFDKSIEENLLQSIQKIARDYYPYAEAFIFGSRKSRTNLSESDLDIYIDCVSSYSSIMTSNRSRNYLENILDCLENYEDIWTVEEYVFQAKVPIIRLKHRKTNINCDISCTNGLGVENSKLIRCYVEAYLPCRKLILFLKKWMHLCRLSGIKGINSYSTSCLVIFYLQTRNILPTVHHLIQLENNPNIIAGWETGFLKRIPMPLGKSQELLNITDDQSSEISYLIIKDFLTGFFSYYSNFDYMTNVICPFVGKAVPKKRFTSMSLLPEEMRNYKTLYEKEDAEMFRFDSPMCVQDPIDLSKNTTKALTKLQLRKFKHYCRESLYLLKASSNKHSQG